MSFFFHLVSTGFTMYLHFFASHTQTLLPNCVALITPPISRSSLGELSDGELGKEKRDLLPLMGFSGLMPGYEKRDHERCAFVCLAATSGKADNEDTTWAQI